MDKNTQICVIGQGYVGLPLAVEFGKHFPTIGLILKKIVLKNYKKVLIAL